MRRAPTILLALLALACSSPEAADVRHVADLDVEISPAERLDPSSQILRDRLREETITFSFDGAPLPEALDFIRTLKGINIVIGDEVQADLEDAPLTLSVSDLEVDSALDLLLRLAGPEYTYMLRDGVVFVTSREGARNNAILRVHDISDLTIGHRSFIAPNLILRPAGD